MRLTLRNLLAYMDDILDSESARIIGQKTEESEFASGLLNRIRDVTRQSKLGAPEVIDRKAALDPNTVAEYLDNTLPADRVTDFEKACLDSDVELAEVSACHQILTLVLGEPAEVRPESRSRMYHLPETAASHTYVETAKTEPDKEKRRVDTPVSIQTRHPQPRVPEYLLETRRRRRRMVMAAAIVLLVAGLGYWAFTKDKGDLVSSTETPPVVEEPVAVMPAQPGVPAETEPVSGEPSVPTETPTTPEPSAEVVEPASPATPVVAATDPGTAPAEPETQSEAVPGSVVPVTPVPVPPPAINATSETPLPVTPLEPEAPETPPAPEPGQMADASVPPAPSDNQETMVAEPVAPESVEQGQKVARLITPDEMLLASPNEEGLFRRVAISAALRTGQRIVSLPTSRPVIRLADKIDVGLVDGGEIHLLPPDENGTPGLEITAGRINFLPTDEAQSVSLRLRCDGVDGILRLADSTTLVAMEVGRADGPIKDPLTQPVPVTAQLWGVAGDFSWTPNGGTEMKLSQPMSIDLAAGPQSAPMPLEAPPWVRNDLADRLSRQASGILNRGLDPEKDDADLVFHENAVHRRKEVRELSRQCLSWIEDFGPIVEVLNDPERYAEWPNLIDLLRSSVRRSPRTAQAVREAMGVKYGPRGEELHELLWKYDVKDLPPESAEKLVEYLDDSILACRVLSFRNLNHITGLGYYYRPQESELERGPSIKRWADWAERLAKSANPEADESTK